MAETKTQDQKDEELCGLCIILCFCFIGIVFFGSMIAMGVVETRRQKIVPKIEIASMDLTVHNITQTHLSADWDLLTRIPTKLINEYICLQGDLQASLFYKNVTLVTSSRQRYIDLKLDEPQQLRVSASISDLDIGGLIGKNMMEDIKERREVKFGSQLFLTDCRQGTTGVMSYVCDETTLRFEPDSEMKAISFGKNPTCTNI